MQIALRLGLGMALPTLIAIPAAVYARNQADRLERLPIIEEPQNSQVMAVLDGYLNTNPTGTGGAELSIIDGTALALGGEATTQFVDAPKSGGQISVYVVRSGDTLSSIAEMFDVSVNTIIWANDIRGTKIREGQELVILPITGVRHVVKSGDTLSTIANKYKASIEDILSYNGIAADAKIATGDVIVVPGGEIKVSATASAGVSSSPSTSSSVASGYFIRPITSGIKSQGIHSRNAVDIAASIGTPIVASAGGRVIVSRSGGYNGGYGSYVVISHSNGVQTLYAHMSRVDVSVGQSVAQGQTIGAVGNTGRSTGPHVHFEVRGARNPF